MELGGRTKKMHLFQGRLRGGLFSLNCEVFIPFKSANQALLRWVSLCALICHYDLLSLPWMDADES